MNVHISLFVNTIFKVFSTRQLLKASAVILSINVFNYITIVISIYLSTFIVFRFCIMNLKDRHFLVENLNVKLCVNFYYVGSR